MQKPIIGFTLGDINGIGPELILKTLNETALLERITPIVFGSNKVLNFYKKFMPDITVNVQQIRDVQQHNTKQINVINVWEDQANIKPGELTDEAGKYAALSLIEASKALKENKINVLITAPIHKKNIKTNNFNFVGHTPFFKDFFAVSEVIMLMVSDSMRVALLTEHIAIKDIVAQISASAIINKLTLLDKTLKEDFLIDRPRIAVLGLNPHAGDDGILGKEETDIIKPAIKQANNNGIFAFGPYSADGFFARSHEQKFDAVLAMYHDQGLVPFKSLSLGAGINYTAGLNVVRTSPDHGTGFDIAGKNIADASSFQAAIFKGIDIYNNKNDFKEMRANPLKKQNFNFGKNDDKIIA